MGWENTQEIGEVKKDIVKEEGGGEAPNGNQGVGVGVGEGGGEVQNATMARVPWRVLRQYGYRSLEHFGLDFVNALEFVFLFCFYLLLLKKKNYLINLISLIS